MVPNFNITNWPREDNASIPESCKDRTVKNPHLSPNIVLIKEKIPQLITFVL